MDLLIDFVRKHDGYPAAWARALPNLDEAVKLIQENPDITFEEYFDKIGINQE